MNNTVLQNSKPLITIIEKLPYFIQNEMRNWITNLKVTKQFSEKVGFLFKNVNIQTVTALKLF